MGIVDKIQDKMGVGSSSTSSSSKTHSTTHAPTHGEHQQTLGKGPNLVGDSEASTTDRNINTGKASSRVATAADNATETGERVRTGDDTYDRHTNAPVVKERVRDEYQHNVQPVVQQEHDKTDVIRTVQPLKDNKVESTNVHTKQREDQFREVGQDERLARETEERLRLEREKVARQGGRVHAEDKHEFTENAPQVSHTERKHVIEEVQPVVERDVLRPHEVQEQQNIFVHHKEAPQLHETRVAPTMSVQEYERSQASNDESQRFKRDDAVAR